MVHQRAPPCTRRKIHKSTVKHETFMYHTPRKTPIYPETFEIQVSPSRAQELPKPQELFSQMNNEKIKKRSDGPKSHWLQIGWTTAPPPRVRLISFPLIYPLKIKQLQSNGA